jgi:triosephosphate isomerase
MRKLLVAANWKMNKSLSEGVEFLQSMKAMSYEGVDVVINVPYIHLTKAAEIADGAAFKIGAQNVHHLPSGAYTGEISAQMIASTGASFVVIGHSERRAYFGESDSIILEKVEIALSQGLTPIFCCGEPLEVRDAGTHVDYVASQLHESIFKLENELFEKVIIAYEPIWAIGTGRTATADQAQEMHAAIRELISISYNADIAASSRILYGGSCSPKNAKELFSLPDVDGGLIGGASLQVEDFGQLITIGSQVSK